VRNHENFFSLPSSSYPSSFSFFLSLLFSSIPPIMLFSCSCYSSCSLLLALTLVCVLSFVVLNLSPFLLSVFLTISLRWSPVSASFFLPSCLSFLVSVFLCSFLLSRYLSLSLSFLYPFTLCFVFPSFLMFCLGGAMAPAILVCVHCSNETPRKQSTERQSNRGTNLQFGIVHIVPKTRARAARLQSPQKSHSGRHDSAVLTTATTV
jgi:hypothetical protein